MKKFLTKDESTKLVKECGIDVNQASYVELTDTRYNEAIHETFTYHAIYKKTDRIISCWNALTKEYICESRNYNDEDSVFSIGDLINIILSNYEQDINEVLESMNFNFYCGKVVDDKEFIDYLYNYIVNHE